MKITPAHDFNDFEVGKRCGLAAINMLDQKACVDLSDEAFDDMPAKQDWHGLERYDARKKIVETLQALGLVDELGGLHEAVKSCAKRAELSSYRVEHFTLDEEPWRRALREFGVSLRSASLEAQIRALHTKIQRMGGIQARETLLL